MPSATTCGWSNMSSTGRAAAHGTRSPSRASHSSAVWACRAARRRGTSRPACSARFRTVSKRGSLASSGRPVSSQSAFQKCGVLAET